MGEGVVELWGEFSGGVWRENKRKGREGGRGECELERFVRCFASYRPGNGPTFSQIMPSSSKSWIADRCPTDPRLSHHVSE